MDSNEVGATVRMNEQGRVYIPASVRDALGIAGEAAHLDLDIRLVRLDQDGGD